MYGPQTCSFINWQIFGLCTSSFKIHSCHFHLNLGAFELSRVPHSFTFCLVGQLGLVAITDTWLTLNLCCCLCMVTIFKVSLLIRIFSILSSFLGACSSTWLLKTQWDHFEYIAVAGVSWAPCFALCYLYNRGPMTYLSRPSDSYETRSHHLLNVAVVRVQQLKI